MSDLDHRTYDEDKFQELLGGVNGALGAPEMPGFKWTTARKEHEDLFGDIIRPNEDYLKRERLGLGWGQEIKLSVRSMDKLLLALDSPGSPLNEFLKAMKDRPGDILAQYVNAGSVPY